MAQQNSRIDPLPIYSKNMLTQIDSSYVTQEEEFPASTIPRKISLPNPPSGIMGLLGNFGLHQLNTAPCEDSAEVFPIHTENLPSQVDPSYLSQQNNPPVTRGRKISLPNTPSSIRGFLGNWDPHMLNIVPHEDNANSLPMQTENVSPQIDPSSAAQQEYRQTSTRGRKISLPNPPSSFGGLLGNWEPHQLSTVPHEGSTDTLPMQTENLPFQTDPSTLTQQEDKQTSTRGRKISLPNPPKAVMAFLGNWESHLLNMGSYEDISESSSIYTKNLPFQTDPNYMAEQEHMQTDTRVRKMSLPDPAGGLLWRL